MTSVAAGRKPVHLSLVTIARLSAMLLCLTLPTPAMAQAEGEALPETMDAPLSRPAEPAGNDGEDEEQLPQGEVACRARLHALGAVFVEHAPIEEPSGCSAPHPITLSQLAGDVELRPPAVLTCAMAETTVRFVQRHAAPLSRGQFGVDLAAIDQVSSYVCRARSSGGQLSEHAFANALDWGSLELADGTRIDVLARPPEEPRRTRLIDALRKAACGPFKTVLGPGSDADHEDHLHFDLAERRNGATYCR